MPINATNRFKIFIDSYNDADITQLRNGQSFRLQFDNERENIIVPIEVLSENILPLEIFYFVITELEYAVNCTLKTGNGNSGRLGSRECPCASIEGLIASRFYSAKEGDSVFRRISAVANILVAAGICERGLGILKLRDEFKN